MIDNLEFVMPLIVAAVGGTFALLVARVNHDRDLDRLERLVAVRKSIYSDNDAARCLDVKIIRLCFSTGKIHGNEWAVVLIGLVVILPVTLTSIQYSSGWDRWLQVALCVALVFSAFLILVWWMSAERKHKSKLSEAIDTQQRNCL